MGWRHGLGALAALTTAVGLQGCVAAIPVLMAASLATEGFVMFKTVQTVTGGGKVQVGFGEKGEKNHVAPPLPRARRIGIWPTTGGTVTGGAGEVAMAEKLSTGPGLAVVTPNQMQQALARSNIKDMTQLTGAEKDAAFLTVCRSAVIDQIYIAQQSGERANMGFLTLGRANTTTVFDLQVFDCRQRRLVWQDKMTVVVDMTGARTADPNEILKVVGQAWADWMLAAPPQGELPPETKAADPAPPAAKPAAAPARKPTAKAHKAVKKPVAKPAG